MNKSLKLLLVVALVMPFTALAESVSFEMTSLQSDYVPEAGKIHIFPDDNGKLRVFHDPNICSSDGICTMMMPHTEVVEAKVIVDNRPTDGSLILKLTPQINLSVSSGFNLEGRVHYTAIVKSSRDPKKRIRVPLKPYVYLRLDK